MGRHGVLVDVRCVRSQRLSQFLEGLAEVDGDFWLVDERLDHDLDEEGGSLYGLNHDFGVVRANLKDHPCDGLSDLD